MRYVRSSVLRLLTEPADQVSVVVDTAIRLADYCYGKKALTSAEGTAWQSVGDSVIQAAASFLIGQLGGSPDQLNMELDPIKRIQRKARLESQSEFPADVPVAGPGPDHAQTTQRQEPTETGDN